MKQKQKINVPKLLKIGMLLFGISLLLWNCESDEIQIPEKNRLEIIDFKQIPSKLVDIIPEVKEKNNVFSKNNINENAKFNFNRVAKLIDSLDNTKITIEFTLKNQPNNVFYNLILGESKNGEIIKPLIHKYTVINYQEFRNSLKNRQLNLKGKKEVFNYDSFKKLFYDSNKLVTANKTSCEDNQWENIDWSYDEGNGGSGGFDEFFNEDDSGWRIEWGDGDFSFPVNQESNKNAGDCYGESDGGGGGYVVIINTNDKNCANGYVYDPVLDTCVEEDKIINELTGKADCVYQKMVDGNNNINWILNNFKDGNKLSEFDLIFKMSSSLSNLTNATTTKLGNTFVIEINQYRAENINTVLTIARTILHEGIHARLREFAAREGSNETSFPGVYDYYRNFKKNWDHEQMAAHYRGTIADGLKEFDNGQHSDNYYNALAWEGLSEIRDLNGNQEIIYTKAWNKLSSSEQQNVLDIIKEEKQNGNKTCQ